VDLDKGNSITIVILIIGLCILLRVYQPIIYIYIETSVRNKCRCSFYCALLTLHVLASIGGHGGLYIYIYIYIYWLTIVMFGIRIVEIDVSEFLTVGWKQIFPL
jgi:hypothetical protein